MASVFQMLPMVLQQNFGAQVLHRTPEPDAVTKAADDVDQYDEVMSTKLAINYAIGTEAIYRARQQSHGGSALDLCCGPGHLAINLTRDLQLNRMLGVDLSAPMVSTAAKNAKQQKIEQATFEQGDAANLNHLPGDRFDLATMTDAAHHFPDLKLVAASISEMDRVTKPDGLVLVMDLVRLRTKKLTQNYVNVLGADYQQRGLSAFFQQFQDSMFAAWTPDELATTVPDSARRKWYLLVPRGLPYAQFLFGIPHDQPDVFVRADRPWTQIPLRKQELAEFRLASIGLRFATKRRIA